MSDRIAMPPTDRTYLDNAATSWPKPPAVYDAIDRYMRQNGAPAGRGAYGEAVEVERLVNDTRKRLADLIGEPDSKRIIFTNNGTDSLNLVLHGLLTDGDHVVTSVCEHNSVLRPLRHLEQTSSVEVTRVECSALGIVDPNAFEAAIKSNTKLFVLTHASNVTGAIQPVSEVGKFARSHGIRFLIDAAQSLGHIPLTADHLNADFIAAPGHKGLLGPLGTGLLHIRSGAEESLRTIRQGGTGTSSETDQQPQTLPDKYESGNHNVPGIVGLGAAVDYLADCGIAGIAQHERDLVARLLEGFNALKHVTVYGPRDVARRVGVVSIAIEGYDPQEVATMLDSAYSVQVRSGFHCASLMHASLRTSDCGGTIRFSVGPFTTTEQIDHAIQAVGEIAASTI